MHRHTRDADGHLPNESNYGCNYSNDVDVEFFFVFTADANSQKNSSSTPFDLSTIPVVKIADLGNACWTVSHRLTIAFNFQCL